MLVVLNPQSNAGTALQRWRPVEHALRERDTDLTVEMPSDAAQAAKVVRASFESEAPDVIVAAGGDGMVNLVLNAMMDPETDRPRRA
ncbi:acylglycerol kinase family protein, partial [Nocardia sp. NPDC004604]|uniref:diacylglycerol/lipid kinase family protein n=1 Tax=Nocardia sp. NPDC004604 TaxID=3157013 RepID=UPI0033A92AE5